MLGDFTLLLGIFMTPSTNKNKKLFENILYCSLNRRQIREFGTFGPDRARSATWHWLKAEKRIRHEPTSQ